MKPGAKTLMRWVLAASEKRQGELPAFPSVAARLVGVLEHPEADVGKVEELIQQDQVITAEVIRAANSVLYGGAVPVDKVRQAVVRMGFRETADVAIAAASRSLYDVGDRLELEVFPEVWKAIWHDSLVCAFGGRLLARELKRGEPERVFLGGMFRNVGALLVLKIVARGLVQGRLPRSPSAEELEDVIHVLHTGMGANYLRSCRMPDAIAGIAERHHEESVEWNADTMDLHIVRLAGGFSEAIGVAPFSTGMMGPEGEQALELLELMPERREYLELQFRELAEQVRGFF